MYSFTKEDRAIIAAAREASRDIRAKRRLRALEMRALGYSAKEIAAETGFKETYIPQLTSKYLSGGIEAISGNHYGRSRRNMPAEKEAELLKPFREKAAEGQVIDILEIKADYEKAVGHSVGNTQIYRVLHRHSFRKAMLRSRQPEKVGEVIEA